jgi:flagellar hook protein FlgE
MSIYGMMRTSISGMAAQAFRLTAVSDNIANADTDGYKRAGAEFTSLVTPGGHGKSRTASLYESGSVMAHMRQSINEQGTFRFTSSSTDLALDGDGFFVVKNESGLPMLTRAGSFVPDGDGNLYNSAGLYLQGYPISGGSIPNVANGFGGLEKVNVNSLGLSAVPSTSGVFAVNLPAGAAAIDTPLPSANAAGSTWSQKSSLTVFDNLGNAKVVDIYMSKTAANTWEVTAYDQAGAAAPGAPFPYGSPALATTTLSFSPADGKLTGASPNSLAFTIPGGSPMTLDLNGTTQLGTGFVIADAKVNGSAPSMVDHVEVRNDGTMYAAYGDGSFRAIYRIPVATVTSPDQLTAATGTTFTVSANSGDLVLGFVGDGKAGRIISSALEQSNVDIAEELTVMIQAQRGYSANSKVFQTGSEVTDIAINLKR